MHQLSAVSLCLLLLITLVSCDGSGNSIGGVGTPLITTVALPDATLGSHYSVSLSAHNAPSSWSIQLSPASGLGLTADPNTGTISGVPISLGVVGVSASAINSSGASVIHQFEIVVVGQSDSWMAANSVNAPIARSKFGSVWTGSQLLIWGGEGVPSNHAGRVYNPASNQWSSISSNGAPAPRYNHHTLWTGTHMFVWGGQTGFQGQPNLGGLYHPGTDTWTATNPNGAPIARNNSVAVWAGDRVVIWGGNLVTSVSPLTLEYPTEGLVFHPSTNQWSTTSSIGAPDGRSLHCVVWAGNRMLVFGGGVTQGWATKAAAYFPITDTWQTISEPPVEGAWTDISAVWTGDRVIAWGTKVGNPNTSFGATYHPLTDSWTSMSLVDAPPLRGGPTVAWTGNRMIVWGGQSIGMPEESYPPSIYDPATDTWHAGAQAGAPSARFGQAAAWTGDRMVIWGGQSLQAHFNDGAVYFP